MGQIDRADGSPLAAVLVTPRRGRTRIRSPAAGVAPHPGHANLPRRARTSALVRNQGRNRVDFSSCSRGVAQLGSARRSGRRGRRFKSCHPDQLIVAQTIGQFVPLVGRRRRASRGNAGGSFVRGAGVRLPIVKRLVDVGADGANVVPSSSMDTMRRRKNAAKRSRRVLPAGWRRGPRGLREGQRSRGRVRRLIGGASLIRVSMAPKELLHP